MLSQLASFPSFLWLNEISFYTYTHTHTQDFPGGSVVKNLPVNAGDVGLIPGQQRSPGEGSSNPLRYYCLGNPMAEELGRLQSRGLQKSWT